MPLALPEGGVIFQCPTCGYRWLAVIIRPGDGVTAEACAKQVYCPKCDGKGPMLLAK
jgi:hypothetical protein